jgi:hypothetical protein
MLNIAFMQAKEERQARALAHLFHLSEEENEHKRNNINISHILDSSIVFGIYENARKRFSILDNVKVLLALCSAYFTHESVCTRRKIRQRSHICRELNAGLPRTSHFIAFEIHI